MLFRSAYSVVDNETTMLDATSGLLASQDTRHIRQLDVTIRVGSPKLDNYRRQPRDVAHFTLGSVVSLDDNPNALKRRLWLDTDSVYRSASQRLTNIKTDTQVLVDPAQSRWVVVRVDIYPVPLHHTLPEFRIQSPWVGVVR